MSFSKRDRWFQTINNGLLIVLSLLMLLPLLHLVAISFSSSYYVNLMEVGLWPKGFNINVYETIFGLRSLWQSLLISAYITVAGTVIALAFNTSLSYALSRHLMKGRTFIIQAVVVTFIFSAPLIPYYLVVRSFQLDNTLWSLMVPNALTPFYILILITFFKNISSEMFDAAKMDGCSEFKIYYRIALPLSKAALATIALFHAVGQWNSYFQALVFIRDRSLRPLQLVVRDLVVRDESSIMFNNDVDLQMVSTPEMLKAGIIVFSVIPILIVYPFLQKHFVKGATLGSLKE